MINLKLSQAVSIDTNIFIHALKENDPKYDEARSLLEWIKENKSEVFISVLVIEEFLIHVYKQQQDKKIPAFLDFITLEGLCNVVNVNKQVAMIAAKLRSEYPSLRSPDAIHLASAISAGAEIFITTDKRIPRKVGKLIVKVL